ncbi:MAG: hypothetical protein ACD_58C00136G0001, partial [uncultured bacterium]
EVRRSISDGTRMSNPLWNTESKGGQKPTNISQYKYNTNKTKFKLDLWKNKSS